MLDESMNDPFAVWGDVSAITPLDLHTVFDDKQIMVDQFASAEMWLEKGVIRDQETKFMVE